MEWLRQGYILFFVSWLLCSIGAGGPSIYILDEAKNAQCAREMYERNDFIMPTFNGQLRTDKPPLHYFFMRLGYSIGGVSNFWARIFSGLCGAWVVMIVFWLARTYIDDKTAWWSAASLLASMHFTIQFHLAVPDPYLVACMTTGLAFLFHHSKTRKAKHQYIAAAALGLAVLAKGPIGLLLPGLIFLIYLLIKRQNPLIYLWNKSIPVSLLLFSVIAIPWYVLVGMETDGAWLEGFFLDHNVRRFSSTKEGHGGLFIITPIMVFIGMLPGSVLLIAGLKKLRAALPKSDLLQFTAIAAGTVIVFFSISETKLPNYPVPSYPFLGILIGYIIARCRIPNGAYIALLILSAAIAIGGYVGLQSLPLFTDMASIMLLWLVLPIGVILSFILMKHEERSKKILYSTFALGSVLFFTVIFPRIDEKNPVKASAHLVTEQPSFVAYRYLNPAFVFRYGATIPIYQDVDDIIRYIQDHPDALVISRRKHIGAVAEKLNGQVIFEQKDLFENPVTVIFQVE